MITTRCSGGRMTVKDRRGHKRTITAILVEEAPPSVGWHYAATVEPSTSGRHYESAGQEPLEQFIGRIAAQLCR